MIFTNFSLKFYLSNYPGSFLSDYWEPTKVAGKGAFIPSRPAS